MMLLPLEDTYKQITKVTVKADIFQPPMAKIPSLAQRLPTVQSRRFQNTHSVLLKCCTQELSRMGSFSVCFESWSRGWLAISLTP